MRLLPLALALCIAPVPLVAQEVAPGTQVERVTLQPGETASFTLAPGFDHQLLQRSAPDAAGAITISYEVAAGQSTLTAASRADHPLVFTVLADPDGNGGFEAVGEVQLPAGGESVTRSWPGTLGKINVGDFVGGPHGDHDHPPSGE